VFEVRRWSFCKLPAKQVDGGPDKLLIILIITLIEGIWGYVGVGFSEFDEER